MRKVIQDDPDSLLTYRGFIRFLETDLKWVFFILPTVAILISRAT